MIQNPKIRCESIVQLDSQIREIQAERPKKEIVSLWGYANCEWKVLVEQFWEMVKTLTSKSDLFADMFDCYLEIREVVGGKTGVWAFWEVFGSLKMMNLLTVAMTFPLLKSFSRSCFCRVTSLGGFTVTCSGFLLDSLTLSHNPIQPMKKMTQMPAIPRYKYSLIFYKL